MLEQLYNYVKESTVKTNQKQKTEKFKIEAHYN